MSVNGKLNGKQLILNELMKNPRASIMTISKNTGKSRQTISKNIRNLINQNKIRFFVAVRKKFLKKEILNIKLKIKNVKDVKSIVKLFFNCPKTLYILYGGSYNQLQIILLNEREKKVGDNLLSLPYMKIIEKLQTDDRIGELIFEPFSELILPEFIPLHDRAHSYCLKVAPCRALCSECDKYESECFGCPSTIWYKGEKDVEV